MLATPLIKITLSRIMLPGKRQKGFSFSSPSLRVSSWGVSADIRTNKSISPLSKKIKLTDL